MSIILSERIKQCIYCPVCHKTLRLFYSFTKSAYWKDPANGAQFSESDRDSITRLGNLLHLEGSVEEQFKVLHRLMERPESNVDNDKEADNELGCLYILHRMLFELRQLYGIKKDDDFSALSGKIMNEVYKAIHGNYPDETVFLINENKKDHQEQLSRRKKEFICYCQLNTKGKPELEYQYCSKNKPADCQGAYFYEISDKLKLEGYKKSIMELEPLIDKPYWAICEDYLKHAQKDFGTVFTLIMERQGITPNDVSSIMREKSPNTIKALCACKESKHDEDYLHRLARCLLVSDEVLVSGTGVSFGTWKDVLSEDGLNTIFQKTDIKTHKRAQIWTRSKIREWTYMSDMEFEKLMADNPDFFVKEPFCVYEKERDGKVILDCSAMQIDLLHPKEFELLVKTLQKFIK